MKFPPKISRANSAEVEWSSVQNPDVAFVGHFLTCHLLIEHYLEEVLKGMNQKISWDEARLTFAQKLNLLDGTPATSRNFISATRQLNKLRNRFSHNLDCAITADDVEELRKYLVKYTPTSEAEVSSDPKKLVLIFSFSLCSYLAGFVAGSRQMKKDQSLKAFLEAWGSSQELENALE